jgi:ABC-type multidrug transport system fused ATPase/permease subunit
MQERKRTRKGEKTGQGDAGFLRQFLSLSGFEKEGLAQLGIARQVKTAHSETIEALAEEALGVAALEHALDQRIFADPSQSADGPIVVGFPLEAGWPDVIGLYPVEFTQMVLIVGTHGSGKTVLVRLILRQIIENYS